MRLVKHQCHPCWRRKVFWWVWRCKAVMINGGSGDRGGGYQQNHFPQRAQWMLSPVAGVQRAADILTVTV